MFPGLFASDTSSFNNGAYHVNTHKTNTYYACEVLSEVQVCYAVQKRQLKLTVHEGHFDLRSGGSFGRGLF